MIRRKLFGWVIEHGIGFELPPSLDCDVWRTLLKKASRERSTAQWLLADLLVYGEPRYGDAYRRAIEATGLSYQALANMKSVAAKVAISRRRENLSFGHHAEIAALPPAEQDRLLDLAQQAGWSRDTLREEVAKIRAPSVPNRSVRVEIETMAIPLYTKPATTTITDVPLHVPLPAPERYAEEVRSASISITTIGRDGEASTLRAALRELEGWERRYQPVLGAIAGRLGQQLREAIELQLTGAESQAHLNAYAGVAEAKAGIGSWLGFYNEERPHQSLGYRTPRQAYEAECPWICGRSASPTGCAFAHIPTGTTANHRIEIDEGGGRSDVMTVAPNAIAAGTEIGRATP